MKVKIIIEYRDNAINEKIKEDDIIIEGKYGENILRAREVSGYKVLGEEESIVKINFLKRDGKITFYYEKDAEELVREEVNVVEGVEEIQKEEINLVEESEENFKTYTIDLESSGIISGGANPEETLKGIMDAFSYVKSDKSIKKIIFPKAVYLVHVANPIIFDMKDLIIDFNGSRFKAIRNGRGRGTVFQVEEGAENLILTNGIISECKLAKKLNNYRKEYVGIVGIKINSGVNIEVNNLSISGLSMGAIIIEPFHGSKENEKNGPREIKITNCNISNNHIYGIELRGGENCLLENNTLNGNGVLVDGYGICINNKGALAKDIIIKDNVFEDNKCYDLLASKGEDIKLENNKFTSKVEIWERVINYTVINNLFYNSKILFRYIGGIECYENEYINSNLELIYIVESIRNGTPNIHDELYKSTTITSIDDVNIINSKFENYSTQAIKIGGGLNGCSIEGGRIQLGVSLKDCSLSNVSVENINNSSLSNSYTENCIFHTNTSSARFDMKNCSVVDCKLLVSKYRDIINLNIENNIILMRDKNEEFLNIIVGKVRNIMFKNNKVKNLVASPVINISDAILYTIKCELTMGNNEVIQEVAPTVISGIEIEEGWLEIFDLDNNIEIAKLVSQIYYENNNILTNK